MSKHVGDDKKKEIGKYLQYGKLQYIFSLALSASFRSSRSRPKLKYNRFQMQITRSRSGRMLSGMVMDLPQLNKFDESRAVKIIEKQAIYMLAVYVNQVFERCFGKLKTRKKYFEQERDIVKILDIFRFIRNAFTHDPVNPKWIFGDPNDKNKEFVIDSNFKINTGELEGKSVMSSDFNGGLNLLNLTDLLIEKIKRM